MKELVLTELFDDLRGRVDVPGTTWAPESKGNRYAAIISLAVALQEFATELGCDISDERAVLYTLIFFKRRPAEAYAVGDHFSLFGSSAATRAYFSSFNAWASWVVNFVEEERHARSGNSETD